ncbi:MAG TPA: hypothetical protein DEQ50_02700 [Lactobacillus sp.]|nr:hypothetical protein [Lactobacillus sp.]
MKLQKNTNNLIGKKTKQRKRLAAIAGLSLVTGMILTEVSSLNVYAQTDDVLKVEQPAANKVQIQGKMEHVLGHFMIMVKCMLAPES